VTRLALIAGAGMGGLAAALACSRAGWEPRIYEQAPELGEAGAGIQLGPNATRILAAWGLQPALSRVAAVPQQLQARSALDGATLGRLQLGAAFEQRYGAPYLTVHRADLQQLLLDAVQAAGIPVTLSARVTSVLPCDGGVRLRINDEREVEGDVLIGADGLWSRVRAAVIGDGPPAATGHVAYRALVSQRALPAALRSHGVTVWLGPRMHVVAYPVKAGEQLNVVAIVQGRSAGAASDWNQGGAVAELRAAMGPVCAPLDALIRAMPSWQLWTLHDRPPLRSAGEMARGRIALLGDAAHPMRPYLAQGAGMALEDAAELGRALAASVAGIDVQTLLRRYAMNRWERCAKVQARAQRNGQIFHATGLVQWARNLSMRLVGEPLLDQPWLYQ
jgi:salicylate hydroxylase